MDIQKVWGAFIAENDEPSFVKMANAVADQLGGFDDETVFNIYDTFSKYALEEVANRFQNWWYDQDESEFD